MIQQLMVSHNEHATKKYLWHDNTLPVSGAALLSIAVVTAWWRHRLF